MVSRGTFRALGASIAALLLLCIEVSSVMAAKPADCSVNVSPRAGSAGTTFVFNGTGFKPTELRLHKNDSDAGVHSVDVGDKDPWQLTVRSRPGDEGTWAAELVSDDCSAAAAFRVTLNNTDAASDLKSGTARHGMPLLLPAILAAAGAGGGLVLGRRFREVSADNRSL